MDPIHKGIGHDDMHMIHSLLFECDAGRCRVGHVYFNIFTEFTEFSDQKYNI